MKKWIIAFLALLALLVVIFAILGFSGVEPFSTYVDNAVDWWEDTLGTNTPDGTYTRSIYGLTGTLTFTGDELKYIENRCIQKIGIITDGIYNSLKL